MRSKRLLTLLKDRPSEGMERLMNCYAGLVYAVVRGRLAGSDCHSSDVEDCVADTFSEFYASMPNFDSERSSIKAYLCAVARNNASDVLRKRGKQAGDISLDDELLFEIADESTPEGDLARSEQKKRIIAAVESLGQPDSDIIFRKYYYGESSKETARALGLTVSNVDTRAHRALNKLRKLLGGNQ